MQRHDSMTFNHGKGENEEVYDVGKVHINGYFS